MTHHNQNIKHSDNQYIQQDDKLPGLSVMLDAEKVRSLIATHQNDVVGKIKQCDISYIRYKPSTSCIISYALEYEEESSSEYSQKLLYAKVYTENDFINAVEKSKRHRWVKLSDFQPVIVLPEYWTILYFFPNDCVIDGLRMLSEPKKIQRMLYEHHEKYPEEDWRISDRQLKLTIVRYKPERRAVLLCDARPKHLDTNQRHHLKIYIRIYIDDRGADAFALQRDLYQSVQGLSEVAIPKPIAYLPDRKLFFMEALKGKPLLKKLVTDKGIKATAKTARALAALHRCENLKLTEKPVGNYLEDAKSTVEMLKYITPEESGQADEILSILKQKSHYSKSSVFGFVHGDFYYGQVLSKGKNIGVIDFDRSHTGDVLIDVGNFCAHLRLLKIEKRIENAALLEREFIKAYREASNLEISGSQLGFWTAFGLFQLAVGPFRRLEPLWGGETKEIIKECKKILTEL